ncbi:hypothetical protein [Cerasicoccus arenae]|uniref:Uncharacterized protein n=1 Tax=Cerasicoccus arenae TaxID=424488 RepID=A0A8J3D8X4_9BACT|nr:hypothetical protein [Cerasicoccus arenae]MBK1858289.1 hypothetical protein [Cerasicoccus arenae]GHB90558.1 hypothetical protein GCM10007047_01650 [Cerasicoccus arenae]
MLFSKSILASIWILLAAITSASGSKVEPLYEWQFSDPSGTPLSKSQGLKNAEWSADFSDSFADGEGHYRLNRRPGNVSNAFVEIEPITAHGLDHVWLIVEIAGWHFTGSKATETMRVGFVDKAHERRPFVTAQINLQRTAEDQVVVTGEGFGKGAEDSASMPAFTSTQSEPVTFVLELDKGKDRFKLHYRLADGPFIPLGSGEISPDRNGNYLRLGFSGRFDGSGEEFLIDRISVTDKNPIR